MALIVWRETPSSAARAPCDRPAAVRRLRTSLFMVTSMLVTMKSEVRSLRTSAGLSQGALAAVLGVSRQTINAIETGRYDPSLRLAAQLSRYFKQSIEEIFDVEER